MTDTSDAQLLLKKRARRRLVGAAAFAGLAAIVLPMVMDEEPKAPAQDVQIRIPSLDQAPFSPGQPVAAAQSAKSEKSTKDAVAVPPTAAVAAAASAAPATTTATATAIPPVQAPPLLPPGEKPAAVDRAKAADKAPAPAPEAAKELPKSPPAREVRKDPPREPVKEPAKSNKPADTARTAEDARRAAAILGGKATPTAVAATAPAAAPANDSAPHVILIGAFANAANVRQLQAKLGELAIKTYTEALESPQGTKTRLRAGPFANREAAEKALDRMKRIGVSGVVAAKQ
jgi:DedD protein